MEYICSDCPRKCAAVRGENTPGGVCASPSLPSLVRAAPHFGEEPCISGTRGSGTLFFSGCSLRCVFCQNYEISRGFAGKAVTPAQLRDIMLRLKDLGVHNINLVTPSHFTRAIAEALSGFDIGLPVVWNSSGYEEVETLRRLEGLVQVYMPDYKYAEAEPARKYSAAADYPEKAAAAVEEMYRQRGPYVTDSDGLLVSGVLIRHLIIPGRISNSMNVIDFVADTFPAGSVLFSLMSQYTPMPCAAAFPELQQCVDEETCANLLHYMRMRGIADGFFQDSSSATDEMIPAFDMTGI